MIRRVLWLSAGAVLGVTGYRKLAAKVNAATRVLRPEREIAAFARDVRDGIRLYRADQCRAEQDQRPPRLEYPGPSAQGDGKTSRPGGANRYRAP